MSYVDELEPKLKDVLLLRLGLTDKGVLTLEEIGGQMNVTRERVRQLEAKALRRLRVIIGPKHPELQESRILKTGDKTEEGSFK